MKGIKFLIKIRNFKRALSDFLKSNISAGVFVTIFLVAVIILVIFFNTLIANHDRNLSQRMCSLLTEKVTTSLGYMIEATTDKAILIANYASNNNKAFDSIYNDLKNTKEKSNYISIGIILNNGDLYAMPSEEEDLKYQGIISRALSNRENFISNPYRSKITGQMVFTILINIIQKDKKIGCVFVTYDFNKIIELAYSDNIDSRAEVSLVDVNSLNIIRCLSPDKELIGNWSNIKLDKSDSEYDAFMDCVQTIKDENDYAFKTYIVDGQKYSLVFRNISQMDGWCVVISIVNKAFSSAMLDFRFAVVIFFICMFITTIFLLVSFVSRSNKEKSRLEKITKDVIKAFATAVDFNDPYTAGHSKRVGEYSKEIAKRLNLSEDECNDIYYSGLLHDVGKLGIDNMIINKPDKLDEQEYSEIKRHPVMGYEILKDISLKKTYAEGARYHHERIDGQGYPSHLTKNPLVARIIAVADAYDAMTSKRAYRGIMPQHKVREELLKNSGTQFDKKIVDIMLTMMDEDKEYKMHQPD